MPLHSIDDATAFTTTRGSFHALAEHVLAAFRHRIDGRIGLVVTGDGFGTPTVGDGRSARVTRDSVVVVSGGSERPVPITTLREAATACGIEPGAPADVYTPTTPLEPDAPLPVDARAAAALLGWFSFAWQVLDDLLRAADESGAAITLWPEHFDAATELGDEARGQRGTFGASPGDDEHPEPYLYVTHWAPKDDAFWNDAAFAGASLSYGELRASADARAAARDFFAAGREALMR